MSLLSDVYTVTMSFRALYIFLINDLCALISLFLNLSISKVLYVILKTHITKHVIDKVFLIPLHLLANFSFN